MVNFLQHSKYVIQNFCDTFKQFAYKDIWGIELNCSVKSQEEVWLYKNVLDYQLLSEEGCLSGCTFQNPSFIITDYASTVGKVIFPEMFPCKGVFVPSTGNEICIKGSCCMNVQIKGSTLITLQFTTNQPGGPSAGTSSFSIPSLIGSTIQFSIGGYGFIRNGVDFTFDTLSGTITLLNGLLFDVDSLGNGVTYTVFSYK